MRILFTKYFLGCLSTVYFGQVRTQQVGHIQLSDKGENGISLLGITGYAIIEVRWSVRWSGYDRTGDEMVALDLEAI